MPKILHSFMYSTVVLYLPLKQNAVRKKRPWMRKGNEIERLSEDTM